LSRIAIKDALPAADRVAMASEEVNGFVGKERVMADYYACTELEPLLDEIRRRLAEASEQHETLSLRISNAGKVYPYVLEPDNPAHLHRVHEVTENALNLLRGETGSPVRTG
jgi:hypothetical protein